MNIGEVIRSVVYLEDTNVREVAKKVDMSYQTIYGSCAMDKAGMNTNTAVKILGALDYKLVAMPVNTQIEEDWLEVGLNSTGVKKINRTCVMCGKSIPRKEYSQVTPAGRVCQDCINKQFSNKNND